VLFIVALHCVTFAALRVKPYLHLSDPGKGPD